MTESVRKVTDDTKCIISEIIGEKELFMLNFMHNEFGQESSGSYKSISIKKPEVSTRDMLNSECALSKGIEMDRKTVKESKKNFGKFELIMLSVLRLSGMSLSEIEETINRLYEEFRGERIYMDGKRKIKSEISAEISSLLNNKYSMNNKEVGNIIGKSSEQVRRYNNSMLENTDRPFNDIFEDIAQQMDKQHEELLEKQGNKLFLRQGKNSKKYLVIDLNKKVGEKGRQEIVTEKQAEKMLEDIERLQEENKNGKFNK